MLVQLFFFWFIIFTCPCSRNIQLSLTILLLGVGIATVTDLQLNALGSILSLLAIITTCIAQIVSLNKFLFREVFRALYVSYVALWLNSPNTVYCYRIFWRYCFCFSFFSKNVPWPVIRWQTLFRRSSRCLRPNYCTNLPLIKHWPYLSAARFLMLS